MGIYYIRSGECGKDLEESRCNLFVDEDPTDLETWATVGGGGDIKVDTASRPSLDMMASGNYDAVVSDCMAAVDDVVFCEARGRWLYKHLPADVEHGQRGHSARRHTQQVDQYLPRTGDMAHDVPSFAHSLRRGRSGYERRGKKEQAAYHSLLMRMQEGFTTIASCTMGRGGRSARPSLTSMMLSRRCSLLRADLSWAAMSGT